MTLSGVTDRFAVNDNIRWFFGVIDYGLTSDVVVLMLYF